MKKQKQPKIEVTAKGSGTKTLQMYYIFSRYVLVDKKTDKPVWVSK